MKTKHFLDTSVLRPILLSPRKVKEHYTNNISGDIYTCNYVRMEFLRSYIKNIIDFYFLLSMNCYTCFSDALNIWSQRFSVRDQKNMIIMLSNIMKFNDCFDDKEKCLRCLIDYIRRLISKLHFNFKKIGNDNTYCTKGDLFLDYSSDNDKEDLRYYFTQLTDNYQFKNCKIDRFIKQKHKLDIDKIIAECQNLNNMGDKKGFDTIVDNLKKIGDKPITCAFCSRIGDAIITLLSDSNWILEHTDNSFNYLCEIFQKEHVQHPNDKKIMES